MANKRDYYEILEISKDASDSEIKKSFRSLARKYHPDKNPDNPEAENKFKEIQEAYAILSEPNEKSKYDRYGHNRPGGSPFGPGGFQGVNINIDDLFGGGIESIFGQIYRYHRHCRKVDDPRHVEFRNCRTSPRRFACRGGRFLRC